MGMIEAARWCWKFRRFFLTGFVVLAFMWVWYAKTAVERDLARQKLLTADLEHKIENQNAGIMLMAQESERRKNLAEEAMRKASLDAKTHTVKAQRILVEKPVRDDECAATLDLLRKYQ
jgi:hypothetical protein